MTNAQNIRRCGDRSLFPMRAMKIRSFWARRESHIRVPKGMPTRKSLTRALNPAGSAS